MNRHRLRLGQLCWWIQPLVIVTELIAFAFVVAPYSLLNNTISDLGARGCGFVPYPAADVAVCSPAHVVVNAGMVVGGLLLAVGAIALAPTYASGRAGVTALVLWVISGISVMGAGLVPLDVNLLLHALVSTPAILLQPVALGLHSFTLARFGSPHWRWLVAAAGVLSADAVFFLVRLEVEGGGLLERLAVWPVLLALPLLAWRPRVLPRRQTPQPT